MKQKRGLVKFYQDGSRDASVEYKYVKSVLMEKRNWMGVTCIKEIS